MTTTVKTPSEDRYAGLQLELIQLHEYCGKLPFTVAELDVIDGYENSIAGIPDSLDCPDAMPEEWGQPEILAYYKAMFELLRDWREAIRNLGENLGYHDAGDVLTTDGLSGPSGHFAGSQICKWYAAREQLIAAVITQLLGRDESGYPLIGAMDVDYWNIEHGQFWIPSSI